MRNHKFIKYILLVLCITVLAILWAIRYSQINRYYDGLTISKTEIFPMGTEIAFGDNLIQKDTPAKGYTMCVDTIKVVDQETVLPESQWIEHENKVVLVSATFGCNEEDASPIQVNLFQLFTTNMNFGIDGYDLKALNPRLDEHSPTLQLKEGEKCQVLLPFRAYRNRLSFTDWENMEKSTYYISMCMFPRSIYFELHP